MREVAIELLDAPDPAPVVRLRSPVPHKCPINGTTDDDRVEVVYQTAGGVIEVEHWETYLGVYAEMAVTCEDLAALIWRDLIASDVVPVSVEVSGEHGAYSFVEARLGA